MSIPLFRTSLGRSTQFVNVSLRKLPRSVGILNANVIARAPSVILPLHSTLTRSRNFTTAFAVKAAAAKGGSTKKATTTKGRTVTKKKVVKKKKPATKKKPVRAKKKLVSAKKRPVKAKKKKVLKPKAPRIFKKDWQPPFKKPLTSWCRFVTEFGKSTSGEKPVALKDRLRDASLEWKNLSDEQKAAYTVPVGEVEEYRRKLADWNATLSKPVQQARRKYRRARRHQRPRPLGPMSQYVKEHFHQTQFPTDVTTSAQKFGYLAQIFARDVSEDEKQALKQRAEDEFTQK